MMSKELQGALQSAIRRGQRSPRVQEIMKDFAEFGMTIFVMGVAATEKQIQKTLQRSARTLFLASNGVLTWNKILETYQTHEHDGTLLVIVPYSPTK